MGYKSGALESSDDPSNALGLMKKKSFNLVFIYRDLGKINGIQILKDIRSNMRLKNTPVIIYSGDITKDMIVESVTNGANGFLGYPFSVSDVEAAMKQAVSGKK